MDDDYMNDMNDNYDQDIGFFETPDEPTSDVSWSFGHQSSWD